jgi:hypothetical protein
VGCSACVEYRLASERHVGTVAVHDDEARALAKLVCQVCAVSSRSRNSLVAY